MRKLNRKGQGMLEYIIIVGAVMVAVIAFATGRVGPTMNDLLVRLFGDGGADTGQVGQSVSRINNIVSP